MSDYYATFQISSGYHHWADFNSKCTSNGFFCVAGYNIKVRRDASFVDAPDDHCFDIRDASGNLLHRVYPSLINVIPKDNKFHDLLVLSAESKTYIIRTVDCGFVPEVECEDNSDCPDGQKCVDGECVDCENQAATHFRLREEYSELASITGELVSYQLSALYPLPVASPLEISLENHNQLRSWWRVLFCDSVGNPAPYDGEFQINANNNYQVGTGGNVPSGNMLFGPWDNQPDIAGGGNMYISKVFVEFADESLPIVEPVCSGITPESPVEPTPPIPETPPVEPPPEEPPEIEEYPPPDEPSPPAPWPEPWEPPYTPPEKPLPPSEPETGCECEIYLGSVLGQIVAAIYDAIWAAYDRLNTVFQFASGMFGSFQDFCGAFLNLIYQSVMYIVNSYQIEQVRNREKISEVVDELKKISEVVDELKTFNAKFAEFADNYEPVQIENEYRTQSHRVIDNLDSTLNKL